MRRLKKNHTAIVLKAVLLSLGIYLLVLYKAADKLVDNEVAKFHLVTKSISDYQSTIYLLGALFEAEIAAKQHDELQGPYLTVGKVYSADEHSELTRNERIVSITARNLFLRMPEIVSVEQILYYYRSYEGKKIMSTHSFEQKSATYESVFSRKTCIVSLACSKFASERDLEDRLIVSNIYLDDITHQPIITISSPVYFQNVMIGDVNVDVYLDKFPFLADKEYIPQSNAEGRQVFVEDVRYPFPTHAYSADYLADEDLLVTYRVPYSKIVIDNGWLLVGLLIIFIYLLNKLEELQIKRAKLSLAEVAILKDELTSLYNRAILKDSALKYAMEKKGITVIAVDGDKIKAINDNYGHHVGDEAIIHIAESMRRCFRESDYLIRSGGDEFIVILPGCSLAAAEKLAEQLCYEAASKPFGSDGLTLNISVGVSELREGESLQNVLKRADARLYLAKEGKYS
ncbi:diguanylate cyclase [Vibrio methylphosphonaticus]|uniref:diguanylate cyclase n=1 Tax=Vibrio methylphosphonaticus TaxID=2946866 RepID=UPI00202A23A2|nr:diguanylate cyclase [Vibrio methylphosphonaticus]MCL9773842.1 diguanylate cyclase [Vibrio methylphosphonaticus]